MDDETRRAREQEVAEARAQEARDAAREAEYDARTRRAPMFTPYKPCPKCGAWVVHRCTFCNP